MERTKSDVSPVDRLETLTIDMQDFMLWADSQMYIEQKGLGTTFEALLAVQLLLADSVRELKDEPEINIEKISAIETAFRAVKSLFKQVLKDVKRSDEELVEPEDRSLAVLNGSSPLQFR